MPKCKAGSRHKMSEKYCDEMCDIKRCKLQCPRKFKCKLHCWNKVSLMLQYDNMTIMIHKLHVRPSPKTFSYNFRQCDVLMAKILQNDDFSP